MAFRYDKISRAQNELPDDPVARFVELYEAFDDSRRFFEDKAPIRFAAATLVTTPGDAADIVRAVRAGEAELRQTLGFFSGAVSALRLVLAAVLHKRSDAPAEFASAFGAARTLFRAHRLRRAEIYEMLAFTILRGQADDDEIEATQVARVKSIYDALRGHHFVLTGPEDLPACAALAGTRESAHAIGEGTEAVYRALQKRAGWWPGDHMHTASHIMYLSGADPSLIVERAARLCEAFRAKGYKIRGGDYDNIALLCFIAVPVERIVDTVLEMSVRVHRELSMWFGKAAAFNLAVSLAFVKMLQGDEALERLSDVKTLLDMQAIIAAQQAAGAT